MSKTVDVHQALYLAYLDSLGGDAENDAEREVRRISTALDTAMEAAGIDLSGAVADYEGAARRAGFMAGLAAGIRLLG